MVLDRPVLVELIKGAAHRPVSCPTADRRGARTTCPASRSASAFVTRPKRAAFAVFTDGRARLACLLVDYPEHYYQLDYELKPENFALLKSGNFMPAPDPVLKSISIYRSLAKRAMNYRPTGEDRLMIVLCPVAEWDRLDLRYSEFKPAPLPGDQPAPLKPAF